MRYASTNAREMPTQANPAARMKPTYPPVLGKNTIVSVTVISTVPFVGAFCTQVFLVNTELY